MCVLQKPTERTAILFYYKYLKAPNVGLGTDILLLRCVCINTNFVNYCERYEKELFEYFYYFIPNKYLEFGHFLIGKVHLVYFSVIP